MSLTIKRSKDNRVVKCILHRVADIPGGVTVHVANLGGSALFEGTPLAKGENGMYEVCKTAQIITNANETATTYEVAKGHHFKVGDYFAVGSNNGQAITAIDKSNAAKDVITLGTTLGAAVKVGNVAFQTTGANKTVKNTPVAVAGSNMDVEADTNLFVDAWVIGVVRESNAPVVTDADKNALKGIIYV